MNKRNEEQYRRIVSRMDELTLNKEIRFVNQDINLFGEKEEYLEKLIILEEVLAS